MKRAVVLLSGGLDSATTLAIAKSQGYTCHALSFRYGQRHAIELDAAKRVADAAQVDLRIVDIDLRAFGGSALTDSRIDVPETATASNARENRRRMTLTAATRRTRSGRRPRRT